MFTIQWRPIINALTKPLSYRILFVPRNTAGYDDMAADISASHPNYNADLIRSLAPLIFDWILQRLINGDQVTLKDAFRFRPSFTGRLNSPDDSLPDNGDLLGVSVFPSRSLLQRLRTPFAGPGCPVLLYQRATGTPAGPGPACKSIPPGHIHLNGLKRLLCSTV